MIDDSYSLGGAKHYDTAYSVKDDLVDRDFYLDLADEYGEPFLEFGVGSVVVDSIKRRGEAWGLSRLRTAFERYYSDPFAALG